MADHYLEFSQVLPHLSDEEFDWLQQQLEIFHVFGTQEFTDSSLPPNLDCKQADWSGYRFRRDYEDENSEPDELGFCFQLVDQDGSDFGRHFWVYAEENGELGPLSYLVQMFLRRFRPDESWSVGYACTCSKPRVDSCGGGSAFVTAHEIKFDSSWDFVDRETAAFAAGRTAAKVSINAT